MKRIIIILTALLLPLLAMSQGVIRPPKKSAKPQQAQTTQQTVQPQRPSSGRTNGHEWIDLGLSVKWASCNVGASTPSDYGNYYAWGETSTKSEFSFSNSKTYNKDINDITGDSSYDAARSIWGSPWRLPTKIELQELVSNCTWTWTTMDGKNGFRVTSKKNGNSIFLPAAGEKGFSSTLLFDGKNGNYWGATSRENDKESAFCLKFSSLKPQIEPRYRNAGFTIRPVAE